MLSNGLATTKHVYYKIKDTDTGMDKNINKNRTGVLLLCMMALFTCILGACDDTMGGDTNTAPEFPEDTLTFAGNPNDTIKVPFSAGVNWKIVSNKGWCRVDGKYLNASGACGKQEVSFVISDEGHGFVADQAEITLWMNDESRVIAYITRWGKEFFMKVSGDSDVYAPGESIALNASGSLTLNVETNFGLDHLRMQKPDWLQVTRDGASFALQVVKDSVKYAINNPTDSLRFFNSDTTFTQSYHVQYLGMDAKELRVSSQIEATLMVSRDAKRCHVGDTEYKTPIAFTVEALDDAYKLVSLAYDRGKGYSVMSDDDLWFTIEDDRHGNISLSFTAENAGDERTAYLIALPQAIVDSLAGSTDGYDAAVIDFLWEEVDGIVELKEDSRKFCLAHMTQEKSLDWIITISPETRWNLKVSTDGTTYSDAIRGDSCKAPVKAMVDGVYELVCANYDNKTGCSIVSLEDSWLNVSFDEQDSVEVRFDANEGNERTHFLFALPRALVENLNPESPEYHANLSAELFEEVEGSLEIKAEVEQYIIAKFVQEANENNAMKLFDKEFTPMEVVKETDQEWLDIAASKGVAADKVFRCSMTVGFSYTINPLIPISVWDAGVKTNNDRIEIYGKSGQQFVSGKDNDYVEEYVIMNEIEGDNYMLATVTGVRKKITEDFIIYFIDNDTNYLKAMVVTRL